ncbi:MAG: methyltransferase domain-containing protein [Verrucomicrobiota bacterium]|jgi:SAM-dependent methyltransferase
MNKVGTCNTANRTAWVEAALKKIPAGSRLLDAGAGEQPYRRASSHLLYVSQDFAKYDGKGDGRGLQQGKWDQTKLDLVCDIAAIPEPDGSFDAILCTEVFEHLPEPLLALREFSRLLRPGGQLILTAPFVSFTHFAPYHFSTGFNRYYYETHLPAHGCEIVEMTPNGNYFELIAQEVRHARKIARRYTAFSARPLERLATSVVLRMLARFSNAGPDSSEFACFGYHVRAVKR